MEDRYGADRPRVNYLSSGELDPRTRQKAENSALGNIIFVLFVSLAIAFLCGTLF
jgi:hypothetical protein